MAILKVQDANGKGFDVDTDKLFKINGDLTDNINPNISDGIIKNRVSKVRDIEYLNQNGEVIDNLKVLNDMKSDKINVTALDIEMEATHSGRNHNYTIYYEDSMEKDAESFVNPFNKPVLKNHNEYSEPLGRVKQAWHGDSELTDEKTAIHLKARITDSDAIPKFLDGRYQTVSIGGSMGTVTCSICGKTILKDGKFKFCGHWKGETYKNEVCYWGAKDIEYHEVSTVNNPADDFAQIMKVTVITDDKDNKDNNTKNEEDNRMGDKDNKTDINSSTDSKKKQIYDFIDSLIGSGSNDDTASTDDTNNNVDNTEDANNDSSSEDNSSDNGSTADNTKDNAREEELLKQIEDFKTENENLKNEIKDLKEKVEKSNTEYEALKTECDSYKDKCIVLAKDNKSMIVNSIVDKEIKADVIKEDAKDSRKEELMSLSMKEIDELSKKEYNNTDSSKVHEVARVNSPALAVEDKLGDSNTADSKKKTADADGIKSVEDYTNEIVGILSK